MTGRRTCARQHGMTDSDPKELKQGKVGIKDGEGKKK